MQFDNEFHLAIFIMFENEIESEYRCFLAQSAPSSNHLHFSNVNMNFYVVRNSKNIY